MAAGGRLRGVFGALASVLIALACGCASTPAPSDETAALDRLVARFAGHWQIVEHDEPGPGNAAAEDGTGSEDWFRSAASPLLIEVYAAHFPTRSPTDTAIMRWDSAAHAYQGQFCASFVDGACAPFQISWTGNVITMEGEFAVRGARFAWREVFAFDAPDRFTQTLYQGPAGGELALAATIHAVRASVDH